MGSGLLALDARKYGRWLALCTGLVVAICFALSAGPALAATDWDGDGYTDADCAPLDPAVHPGAVDKPDLAFEDTNCDGIDGDKAKAIFVTLGGNDSAPGTLTNPMRTINAAVTAAATAGKDVYVAGGEYAETVNLADNVGIYGGYEPITGVRSPDQVTSIKGGPAALAQGDTGVILQLLTLNGQADGAGNSYGLRAVSNGAEQSQVLLEKVTAKAAAGGPASGGSTGGSGFTGFGFGGGGGGNGGCGNGILGALGGGGGGGVLGGLGGGGLFGNGGTSGSTGATGANGASGTTATPDGATWTRQFANGGNQGGAGGGGGGGRGGTGAALLADLCGGRGGNGGTGGGGGFGGGGGLSGGGSFGVYDFDSSVVAMASTLQSAAGGPGGNGGDGGFGGGGTGPSAPAIGECQSFLTATVCAGNGFAGGFGGAGGRGGGGGGGAGGPSAAIYQAGAGSAFSALGGTTLTPGTAGVGGLSGNGSATRAASGPSVAVMRSGTAPSTATTDFDGDGITDSSDACPDTPRGASDADGDGCPDRPAKLVDANGNGIPDSAEANSNTSNTSTTTTSTPSGGSGSGSSGSPAPTPRVVAKLTTGFKATTVSTKVMKMIVTALRPGDKVNVTCTGKGCPFKSKTVKPKAGKADMAALFKKHPLRPKAVIMISITRAGAIGQAMKFTITKGKAPKRTVMCMPMGRTKPQLSC